MPLSVRTEPVEARAHGQRLFDKLRANGGIYGGTAQADHSRYPCLPWLQGLAAALPGADIAVWQPGAPQADYAVVWAPPQQFMDEQPGLKALFNIGAGVDALLKLRLPPQALVVRLDDAGMAVQMAEYVCHAVIRHFREFDAYEADMAAGRWGYRKPRLRSDFPIGVMGLGAGAV
jgi:glyoxylate/hydroxypyruvate reductase A